MTGVLNLSAGDDRDSMNFSTVDDNAQIVPCHGRAGYDDLEIGVQVAVYGPDGGVVGVGRIATATVDGAGHCVMTWFVLDVPGGLGLYQYEVSHRGKLTISEADARSGTAAASIGR